MIGNRPKPGDAKRARGWAKEGDVHRGIRVFANAHPRFIQGPTPNDPCSDFEAFTLNVIQGATPVS